MKNRKGFSLTELLVTMVIFSVVTASAVGFLLTQTRGFRQMANRSDQIQAGRFAHDVMRQEVRTAATNVTDDQPTIVYASDSVFAFNSDLLTNRQDSSMFTGAIYVDLYASNAAASSMELGAARAIPGSSFVYPLADYGPAAGVAGDAETVIFRFQRDTSATDVSMYMLTRQVNAEPSELVASGIKRVSGQPFFRYWYDPRRYSSTATSLDSVPRSWLPLTKPVMRRGVAPDTGVATSTRIDQLRAVEVQYQAVSMNGGGAPERVQYMIAMPNVAMSKQGRACGRPPIAPPAPAVAWNVDSLAVMVNWGRAVDDGNGEEDAVRYVLFRRLVGSGVWGNPITGVSTVVGAGGYTYKDAGVEQALGNMYEYALAVQDCTPNLSGLVNSGQVLVP